MTNKNYFLFCLSAINGGIGISNAIFLHFCSKPNNTAYYLKFYGM